MKHDVMVYDDLIIPSDEIEITASRSGGPGGQHVNKTSSRITVRWNAKQTRALNEEQKERILLILAHQLSTEGDLIIHNSASRSQMQNKRMALEHLAEQIRAALYVPKERVATGIPKGIQQTRKKNKMRRSSIKKMRSKKIDDY
jgi:ribosome-associated protein